MKVLRFAECALHVEHGSRYIETVFDDGTKAVATPNWEPDDVFRAKQLGYRGNCWEMCMDHESLHSAVGELFGHGHSVVLWNVAHGDPKKWPEWGREEEGFVTSTQRFVNTGDRDDLFWGVLNKARDRYGLYDGQVIRMIRGLLAEVRAE